MTADLPGAAKEDIDISISRGCPSSTGLIADD
jgi:hypothetical protein